MTVHMQLLLAELTARMEALGWRTGKGMSWYKDKTDSTGLTTQYVINMTPSTRTQLNVLIMASGVVKQFVVPPINSWRRKARYIMQELTARGVV